MTHPASPESDPPPPEAGETVPTDPREKVRTFPQTPGVYLMKDARGRVIYVGKAVNLRSRAGSYFTRAAAEDRRTADLVMQIADVDFLATDNEVDALLLEARLVKDVRPIFNQELKDDKTFPYLQIRTREDFPRVEFTRQPRTQGVRLFGPFTSAKKLRATINALQKIFQFRTCPLDIKEDDPRWKWFRPCLLASIHQCTAPCNLRISKADYRDGIRKLLLFLEGGKAKLLEQLRQEMQQAAAALKFERAAALRDQLQALETLSLRGDVDEDVQPEVFHVDPRRGLKGLQKVFQLPSAPRRIEGVDVAHIQGSDTVASLVTFIDGLPFKHGYKRYRIRTVQGVDDFSSIKEAVTRRYRRMQQNDEALPDLLLIDGGQGQLNAALEGLKLIEARIPCVLSLAKQQEEIYVPGEAEPRRLGRRSFALRLLQYVRDEAHRFAQHYHHILRRKAQFGE